MAEVAPLRDPHVVVVGAGIGGLVSALLLACRGLQVTLLEAASEPGGKMRQVEVDGARIDAGPTVFTMRWVFDQILAQAGSSLDRLVGLRPLSVLARHAWRPDPSGAPSQLDLFADLQASADAIARFAGPEQGRRYLAFCAEARRVYERLEGPHIRAARPSLQGMIRDLGPGGLATLSGLGPFASLWTRLGHHFPNPRLRQLFGRYATYCGASPWQAPATLMLIAHVEQSGVWSVQGGMHALPRALAQLARDRGATLRFGQGVQRILVRHGRACGVRLSDGSELSADAVVFNGDANALAAGLLGPDVAHAARAVPRHRRSLSALTWALHARSAGFALSRHNVFFDDDYRSEFDDVFRRRQLPTRGTVYVCAQDRADGSAKPPGRERLLCLVNAPADGDRRSFDASETDPCLQRGLALLQDCGLQLELSPPQMLRTTPTDFHRLFPGTGGALYGPASHGWMALFKRPGSSSRLPGLYLAGGSVHPGPGVPMAALSGRLAAETLMAHLDSTSRSRRGATSGGTSTPSATTAGTG
ncbi:MAG: phytoene desaturase family protein [Rubrivivax sp.]|nr:phytoene desaturase family protein [Rubrivivax sp.]MDH5338901.1 phytoene desaturase family protein [Rubrivivax sp.]